ncbi:MAG: sigma-70 family RNA polymerase sigma factor, partial [Ruminiclostridium sp.]|nr:sigma-70 family RNA polymerase sigma factor [Ruminiclostridium sp.]
EDHNKRYNHSEAEQLKKVSLEELPEDLASEDDQIGQIISKIMVETVLNSFEERERKLVEMKLYGYTQAEIAKELGLSQSYVSKLEKKIGERLKTAFSE